MEFFDDKALRSIAIVQNAVRNVDIVSKYSFHELKGPELQSKVERDRQGVKEDRQEMRLSDSAFQVVVMK